MLLVGGRRPLLPVDLDEQPFRHSQSDSDWRERSKPNVFEPVRFASWLRCFAPRDCIVSCRPCSCSCMCMSELAGVHSRPTASPTLIRASIHPVYAAAGGLQAGEASGGHARPPQQSSRLGRLLPSDGHLRAGRWTEAAQAAAAAYPPGKPAASVPGSLHLPAQPLSGPCAATVAFGGLVSRCMGHVYVGL